MQVSVENTGNLGRRLKVTVPDSTVTQHYKDKMSQLAKDAHLKGFRKGKVPALVLQQKFGSQIRSEVIQELIQKSIGDAVKDNNLNIAGVPTVESIQNKTGQDLEFTAAFEVYPEISLKDFSELSIEKKTCQIKPQDIEKMVLKMQDNLANWIEVTRPCKMGDKLTVDFARILKKEGATKEEQKNVQMILGSEGVLPGLSEALIGKTIGDEVESDLAYPDDWADEAAAGLSVTLWIKINSIFEKEPLSKAELAKKLEIEENAVEEKIKERMEAELAKNLHDDLRETVLEKILEQNPIEIPQTLVKQEKEAIRREMQRQYKKVPAGALDKPEVEDSAKRRVELGLLLNEVIRKFDIKADGKRIRQEIEKMSASFPNPEYFVEAYYKNPDLLASVERVVLLDSAVEEIVRSANVTEKEVAFDEIMGA